MTTLTIDTNKIELTKEELKTLANEIKKVKVAFKNAQRTKDDSWEYLSKLHALQFQFRHKHIAYCLARGRTYEQIEPVVREGNEPNWTYIRGLQDAITS